MVLWSELGSPPPEARTLLQSFQIYSAFELIGAGVAAGAFYALREEQFPKEGSQKLKKDDPEQNYGSM